MAGTGLDEHHALLHELAVRTLELHRQGGGSVWGAASAIGAYSAELSPVRLHAGAARELKLDRLGDFGGTDALLALLNVLFQVSFARPDHAEAALFLQPTEGVVIGNPGGDAHPAGLGTGAPLCGLDQAVGSHHGWVWAKCVFQSVGGQGRANHGVVLGLVTHPLLAAFPGQLDPPREGAVRAGQADVHAAQGHTAHRAIQASALVFAAALEGLSAPVHRATEDAGSSIFGGAHADLAVGRRAKVTEESLVRVAGVALRAQLAQLLGADAAAAAAVQHEAHARRAARRRRGRALALSAAVLAGGRPAAEGEEEHEGEAERAHGGGHGLGAVDGAGGGAECAAAKWARCAGPEPGRRLWPEVGAWTCRAVVSGAVGRGGCRRAGGGRSPAVGVALAASSQRGRVVVWTRLGNR